LRTQNPAGDPIISVAREKGTGRVLGFEFHVPMRISWSGRECPALVGMNVVVARAYRRQNIFEAMQVMALEEDRKRGYHFFCAFPNTRSLSALIKWNYSIVTPVPLVVRPLDIVTLTKTYVNSWLLQWGVNLGWKIAGATVWRERCPTQNDPSLSIVEDTEFDESYDRFWEQIKTKYDLIFVRDRAFLQWRFRDIPLRTYQVLSARQDTRLLGYVVTRQAEIRGIACGLIVDFLVVPGERGDYVGLRLLHEAMQRFRQAQLPLSGGLILPHTQEFSIMQRAGHIPCPRRFAPQPFHLATRGLSEHIPFNVLTRPEGWYLSIADHDAA